MTKYRVMVMASVMTLSGEQMWPGVLFDTAAEAEKALEKAREEINSTWASPKGVPLWIEAVRV